MASTDRARALLRAKRDAAKASYEKARGEAETEYGSDASDKAWTVYQKAITALARLM
jgi:hypothetical protein